jgi:hypothetical protein
MAVTLSRNTRSVNRTLSPPGRGQGRGLRRARPEPGEIVTIDFSGGPQPGDAGPTDFWVIFNERDAYIARWRHGEDPGDRFRIMENEKGYERAWEVARTATGIRPATRQEVIKWLRGHPENARFTGVCQIGSQSMRIVRTNNDIRFEEVPPSWSLQ